MSHFAADSQEFVDRTTTTVSQTGVDAVIVCSRQSLRHMANLYLPHVTLVPEERVFFIWTKDGRRRLVTPEWAHRYCMEHVNVPMAVWPFKGSPWKTLTQQISEMGLDSATIGLEFGYLTVAELDEFKKALPRATFIGVDQPLHRNRLVKRPDEIAILSEVAAAGERAMVEAIANGRSGMTDREFARELRMASVRQGVDELAWLQLTWVDNDMRTVWNDRPIGPGEVFSIEFGLSVDGYYSDLQRSVAVPPCPESVDDAYRKLLQIHDRTISAMIPGRSMAEVHAQYDADVAAAGFDMLDYWLGHSIGTDVHESGPLWFTPRNPTVFEEGMVFAVEPAIAGPVYLGVEDLVVIESGGARNMSATRDWSTIANLGEG